MLIFISVFLSKWWFSFIETRIKQSFGQILGSISLWGKCLTELFPIFSLPHTHTHFAHPSAVTNKKPCMTHTEFKDPATITFMAPVQTHCSISREDTINECLCVSVCVCVHAQLPSIWRQSRCLHHLGQPKHFHSCCFKRRPLVLFSTQPFLCLHGVPGLSAVLQSSAGGFSHMWCERERSGHTNISLRRLCVTISAHVSVWEGTEMI